MKHSLCPESSSKQTIVTIIIGVTPVTIITPLWAGFGRMLMCHTLPADMEIHVIHYHVFISLCSSLLTYILICENYVLLANERSKAMEGGRNKD